MYVGLKQPRGDGERYVTPAQAAAKETNRLVDYGTFSGSKLKTNFSTFSYLLNKMSVIFFL